MQSLPPEVLVGLLDYLPFGDRKSLSLTSWSFYHLCSDRKLLEKDQVVFEDCVLAPEISPLNIFLKSEQLIYNLRCFNIEINKKSDEFWRKFGPFIKSLKLKRCSIALNYVTRLTSYLKRLEYLEIDDCRDVFMCGTILSKDEDLLKVSEALSSVKTFKVNERHYLSDALFNRLVTAMANLNSISLIGCYINFHGALYKRYYNKENFGSGSDSVLTSVFIMSYLEKAASQLNSLNFTCTKIDDSSLKKIALLDNLNLTEIYLHGCPELTNKSIISLVEAQRGLLVLDVSSCVRLTDKALFAIGICLSKLKNLNISGCSGITNEGIKCIQKLTELTDLSMASCNNVSSIGIEEGICRSTKNKLKYLDLRLLVNFNAEAMIKLSKNLSNLVHLDIGHCSEAISDLSMPAVFGNLRLLQHLKIGGCLGVTDHGLCGIGVNNDSNSNNDGLSLQESGKAAEVHGLSIPHESKDNSANTNLIGFVPDSRYSLSNLKGLRTLELFHCISISDISLQLAICLPELRSLDLTHCPKITDIGLISVSKNNPSIEELKLNECKNFTDEGLTELVKNLHRLRRLCLKGDDQLTNASLEAIKNNCTALQFLDVSRCNLNVDEVYLPSISSLRVIVAD